MGKQVRVSTTGTLNPVVIDALGALEIPHPTVNLVIYDTGEASNVVTITELEENIATPAGLTTIQSELTAGRITLDDELGNPFASVQAAFDHVSPTSAANIGVTPSGNFASTDAQAGFEELQGDVDTINSELSKLASGYSRRKAVINIVDNTATPPTEVTGDRYILDDTVGTINAAWDGAAKNDIVEFDGASWVATTPSEGWVAYIDAQDKDGLFVDDGTPQWEVRNIAVNDAASISYDNATSGATATDLQALGDEHDSRLDALEGADPKLSWCWTGANTSNSDNSRDMESNDVFTNVTEFVCPVGCKLKRITANGDSGETWDAHVYKNGVSVQSLSVTTSGIATSGDLDVSFAQGDKVRLRARNFSDDLDNIRIMAFFVES